MKEMCNDFIEKTNENNESVVSAMESARRRCCQGQTGSITGSMTGVTGGNWANTETCNEWLIEKIGLSQAYVAPQPNANTMEQEQSLICGTAFADLVQPYIQGSNLTKFL